ncbi:MAG TPA: M56 family metallopeptidase, partial [Hyphomonadaceae bacterium]|nr:M56 family metallopeptidase [Hyphomonadaceae bacterium]
MSEIALKFLLANLAAAIAILLVIALRKPARAVFGARLAYSLWLLVPLAAFGSLLPPRIVEIARPAPVTTASYPQPSFAPDFIPASPAISPAETSVPPLASSPELASPSVADPWLADPWLADPWMLGVIVWLAGALAMAAWLLRGQLRFLADARAGFAGPAVAGVFNPRIITPADFEDRFEKNERDVILAHETIH